MNADLVTRATELLKKKTGVDVYAGCDEEFPECLGVVVLDDVGPEKMHRAVVAVLKLGVERVCANVVEKKYERRMRDAYAVGGFKSAFADSWMVNCATVRSDG